MALTQEELQQAFTYIQSVSKNVSSADTLASVTSTTTILLVDGGVVKKLTVGTLLNSPAFTGTPTTTTPTTNNGVANKGYVDSQVADVKTSFPTVEETLTTGTYTLPPNTFVKFGTIESIGFSLDTASEVSGHVNEYVVQFDTYHTPPTVGFPSTVIFPETLTLEADMTYQISIVNNLALVQSWPNS